MFYGLQLWWKVFWGRPRFIPLFNVFTRLNKHILKERNLWPWWEHGGLGSAQWWPLFSDWHSLVTMTAIVGSEWDLVRTLPWVPHHPPHEPLWHNPAWNRFPFCGNPINTCRKTLCLRALECLQGRECIIDSTSLVFLYPALAHLNIFGKWV